MSYTYSQATKEEFQLALSGNVGQETPKEMSASGQATKEEIPAGLA